MRKKKPVQTATLTPIESLELRQCAFQVSVAEAALLKAIEIRNAQAAKIASGHGIDLEKGPWHIDADAGTITKQQGT